MNSKKRQFLRSTACCCILGLLLFLCGHTAKLKAQPVISAGNMALGGGGTAYLTGYKSVFYNPANLAIHDREGRFHFGVGHMGILFQPVLSTDNIRSQGSDFLDIYAPYVAGRQSLSASEREIILEQHYPRKKLVSQHQSRIDLILGGVQWQRDHHSYSLVARSRAGTRIEVGRGWYSQDFIDRNRKTVRDLQLTRQSQILYELSFGYAREFDLINGLFPRVSKLYIGIAPKLILSNTYENAFYDARYEIRDDQAQPVYISRFTYHSGGNYSKMVERYRATKNLQGSVNRYLGNKFNFSPAGYGLGIDFGLTYLIPLGGDLSFPERVKKRNPVNKSLRIAFSVTDLGIIYHQRTPLSIQTHWDTTRVDVQGFAQSAFMGSPGQFANYFDKAQSISNPFLNPDRISRNRFSSLLPTSVNAGVLLDLIHLKLMGDLTLGLNNTAFTNTRLTAHLGMELRPVSFIPLRMGTRLAAGTPVQFGFGTGLETRHWSFSIASQVLLRSASLTSEITGGAVAGLQFHL